MAGKDDDPLAELGRLIGSDVPGLPSERRRPAAPARPYDTFDSRSGPLADLVLAVLYDKGILTSRPPAWLKQGVTRR